MEYSRYERFAQLRAANPEVGAEEILLWIHDEEVNESERQEGERILSETDC